MKNDNKNKFSRNHIQTPSKKNTLTSLEVDEFWEDCLIKTCFPVYRQTKSKNKIKEEQTTLMHLYSRYPQLKSMDDIVYSPEIRKKEAMENCCNMYERARQSHLHKQRIIEETMNSKISNDLSNCTWYPKINKSNHSSSLSKHHQEKINTKVYRRTIEWEYHKQIKRTIRKEEELKESPPLSFRPQVRNEKDYLYGDYNRLIQIRI